MIYVLELFPCIIVSIMWQEPYMVKCTLCGANIDNICELTKFLSVFYFKKDV